MKRSTLNKNYNLEFSLHLFHSVDSVKKSLKDLQIIKREEENSISGLKKLTKNPREIGKINLVSKISREEYTESKTLRRVAIPEE